MVSNPRSENVMEHLEPHVTNREHGRLSVFELFLIAVITPII